MERRKFIKGIAAVLGVIAIFPSLLKGQEKMVKKQRNLLSRREHGMYPLTYEEAFKPRTWKLIFDVKGEFPERIEIELQYPKGGNGWKVHDSRQFRIAKDIPKKPYTIDIDTTLAKGEIHTVVLSYKYKDDAKWKYIYISGKNFNKENDYIFKIELLEKGSKFDQTYIGHDPVSGSYSITICKIPGVDSMIRT